MKWENIKVDLVTFFGKGYFLEQAIFSVTEEEYQKIQELKASAPKGYDIEIKAHKEKRSRNANAYAWVLMDKIAAALRTTKEEVYREIVKRVGVYDLISINKNAVTDFMRVWESNGLGWIALEHSDASPRAKILVLYKGTSVYKTDEMSRFIDEVISEAKSLGIETLTPNELAELKEKWEGK